VLHVSDYHRCVTLPASQPGAPLSGSSTTRAAAGSGAGASQDDRAALPSHGLPGGRVVTVASLLVIGVAIAEALLEDRIGLWTVLTLVSVAVIAPVVTRPGDRSLPAMMPPLAFLTAVLVAGQWLLPETGSSLRTREAVMIVQTLGPNALWVIIATILAVSIAAIGHVVDRRIAARRSTSAATTPPSA
jgi:hypothetical protein